MLQLILYQASEDWISWEKWQKGHDVSHLNFVVPNPELADSLRKKLLAEKFASNNIEVETISHFASKLFRRLFPEKRDKLVGKDSYFLLLSSIWKQKFSDLPYELFYEASVHLTDYRSYSLDYNLLSSVIDELRHDLSKVLKFFWPVTEQLGIIDEHSMYGHIADHLLGNSDNQFQKENHKKTYIFFGATYYSALQLDFIHALAKDFQVCIPLPLSVWEGAHSWDWPKWLKVDEIISMNEMNKAIDIESRSRDIEKPVKCYIFNKNQLGHYIDQLFIEGDIKRPIDFMTSIDPEMPDSLPYSQIFFKRPVDLFVGRKELLSFDIENKLEEHSFLSVESLIKHLKAKLKECSMQTAHVRYRDIKLILMYLQLINEWSEISNKNKTINSFDWRCLNQVINLRLPRLYALSGNQFHTFSGELLDFQAIHFFKKERPNILFLSEHSKVLFGDDNFLSLSAKNILASIGPLRRTELKQLFFKGKISTIFSTTPKLFIFRKKVGRPSTSNDENFWR